MTGYIVLPVVRNSTDAELEMFERIQVAFPTWQARDADLATIIMRAAAVIYTDAATLASSMTEEAFRFFGRTLASIPPIDESPAIGQVTITTVDDVGYTIPAGLQISGRGPTGDTVAFATIAPLAVPVGQTSIVADVEAVLPGVGGNDVTGVGAFEDYLDFLATVTFIDSTMHGVDREDDDVYLDRLSEELQLQSPTPILPNDFAILARRIAGVAAATAIDNYDGGQNEVTRIVATSDAGNFTITVNGDTSDAIEIQTDGLSNADIKMRIVAHADINEQDVNVTGGPMSTFPIFVEWTGQYANTDVTVSVNGVGTSGLAATTFQVAAPVDTDTDRSVTVGVRDAEGLPVGAIVRQQVRDYLESMREVNFQVLVVDPTYTTIDVDFTFTAYPDWDPDEVTAAAEAAVAEYLSPALWGVREGDVAESFPTWLNEPDVRYLEVARVLRTVDGLRYVDSLEIEGGTADVPLTGIIPLPLPGTITGAPS